MIIKFDYKKILLAGILSIIGVSLYAFPAELFFAKGNSSIYTSTPAVWKFLNPSTGEFIWSFWDYVPILLAKFIALSIFALIFELLYSSIPGKGIWKGFYFAIIVYLITIPARIDLFFFIRMSNAVNLWWAISHFIELSIVGIILGYVYRKGKGHIFLHKNHKNRQ